MPDQLNFIPKYFVACGKTADGAIYPFLVDDSGQVLIAGCLNYQGLWNATTNTPTLADGTGTKGHYYVVSVAGSQDLGSGSITFAVGDWVVHNGTIWQKADHSNLVSSVNGRTGAVTGLFEADGSVAMSGNIELNGNWLSGDGDNEGLGVDANGNVGIGTLTPAELLNVNGGDIRIDHTSSTLALYFVRTNNSIALGSNLGNIWFGGIDDDVTNTEAALIYGQADGTWAVGDTPTRLKFNTCPASDTTSVTRMTIKANGNIGINTLTPDVLFHVVEDDTAGTPSFLSPVVAVFQRNGTENENCYIEFISGNNGRVGLYFGDTDDDRPGRIEYENGDNEMSFWTNDTERVWIMSDGRVSIGNSSPAASAILELSSTVGALLLPRMTTTQRDALTGVSGMIIYNTTTNAFNFYENGSWVSGSGLT